jgi:hypothetical protein
MEIKKKFYIFTFSVLGIVLGLFIAELTQLIYLKLLLSDFTTYSFGLSWGDLGQFYYFFSTLLVTACGLWGFAAGKYWWRQIYVLKKFGAYRWRHFVK